MPCEPARHSDSRMRDILLFLGYAAPCSSLRWAEGFRRLLRLNRSLTRATRVLSALFIGTQPKLRNAADGKNRTTAVCAGALLFAASLPSHADELRPLREAINQENSASMNVYVLKRCSALSAAISGRMNSSGRDDVGVLARTWERNSIVFYTSALAQEMKKFSKSKENSVAKTIMDDVLQITKLYIADMNASYARTGNSLSDRIQDDTTICAAFLKK